MGTTNKGLDYPEPTGYVAAGASAIQELAEDTDDALGGALFRATVTAEPVAHDTPDKLNLTLTVDDSDVFSNTDGNLITYTGPNVTAAITAGVTWAADGAGSRRIGIIVDGVEFGAQKVNPIAGEAFPMSTTAIVRLTSGDKLGLEVKQTSGGSLDVTSARFRCALLGIAPGS